MALPGEMINFRGLHLREDPAQGGAVRKVAVMEKKPAPVDRIIGAQMLDARAQQVARAPDDPVNGIAFRQQQLSQVGAVLAGDAGNQCAFRLCHV